MSHVVKTPATAAKSTPSFLNPPCIMGIINRSCDSFYSPQKNLNNAIDLAHQMIKEGAQILDIGGEATNPAVRPDQRPALEQELERVIPTIEAFKQRFSIALSVDTTEHDVMKAALDAGAHMINDQRGLPEPQSQRLVASYNVPVCLMHFPNGRIPQSSSPTQLLQQIQIDLKQRSEQCQQNGIAAHNILLDPGFGQGCFGKNTAENVFLMGHLQSLKQLGHPLLIGWSRKSMISDIAHGVPVEDRLPGSIAAALFALQQGATVLRVHDVGATVQAVKVWQALQQHHNPSEIK